MKQNCMHDVLLCKTAQGISRGTEVFAWSMLSPPQDSRLAVVLLKTASGICLQVILSLLTSWGCCIHTGYVSRPPLPTSLQPDPVTSQWPYALNKSLYAISLCCHEGSTISWHFHNYENKILSFRKSTLYSSYSYCNFIDKNFVMLLDRNCLLWFMNWLA